MFQIINDNHFFKSLFTPKEKEWSKVCIACPLFNNSLGLISEGHQRSALLTFSERNPMVISGFPSQRASNVEGVSIWWCATSSCGDITATKNTTKHSLSLRDIQYIPNNGINHEDTLDNPERPTSLFDTYDKPYNIFIILGRISGGNGSYILIINSLVPGRSGCDFVNEIFCLVLFFWLVSLDLRKIMPSDECYVTVLMMTQNWFR